MMEIPEQYLNSNIHSHGFFSTHDLEEEYRDMYARDQLSRITGSHLLQGTNSLQQQLNLQEQQFQLQQMQLHDSLDRSSVDKQVSVCHGCGHLGHSRPNCPYKDFPGWIARGKRNHPLDVDQVGSNSQSMDGVCHGCGIAGHSRPSCPYKDAPGYFPYGHRRIPLDVASLKPSNSVSSTIEICHGCGYPNHSRPQCPHKDIPGWQSRGQRRVPMDIGAIQAYYASQGQPAMNRTGSMDLKDQIVTNSTLEESHTSPPGTLSSEIYPNTLNVQSSKYDGVGVPRIAGLVQSVLPSVSKSIPVPVNIVLDPSKVPNVISSALFNQLSSMSEVSISRRPITISQLGKPSTLSFYIRLKVQIPEIDLSLHDDFYVSDIFEPVTTADGSTEGLHLGYYAICQYNLFGTFAEKFTKVVTCQQSGHKTPAESSSPTLFPLQERSASLNSVELPKSLKGSSTPVGGPHGLYAGVSAVELKALTELVSSSQDASGNLTDRQSTLSPSSASESSKHGAIGSSTPISSPSNAINLTEEKFNVLSTRSEGQLSGNAMMFKPANQRVDNSNNYSFSNRQGFPWYDNKAPQGMTDSTYSYLSPEFANYGSRQF